MAKNPKLGIQVNASPIVLTEDNPDDYVGDRYVQPAVASDPQAEPSGLIRRVVGDTAVSALKGAIGVPEAAVGLADIATGGAAGKFLENEGGMLGFRPKEAKAYLDEFYSPEQRAAFQAVQQASNPNDSMLKRIADIGVAAVQNPSTIVHSAVESLPLMGAGGVLARGASAVAAVPRFAAAGVGEGLASAGSTAEQVRQESQNGLLTPQQSGAALVSGAAVTGLGMVAAKAAKSLGIGDIDVLSAGGEGANKDLKKNLVRRVLEGALTEGVMEELPQSVAEQVAQNYALGKPLDEGVDQAIVMGTLTGGAMGVGAQALHGPAVPNAGPLSRAANVAAASGIAPTAPTAPTAPAAPTAPTAPVAVTPEREKELLDHANKRAAELKAKQAGSKAEDGAEIAPQALTPAEQQELDFLAQAGGDVQALARAYVPPPSPNVPPVDDQAAIAKMEREQRRLEGEALGRSRAAAEGETPSDTPPAAAPAATESSIEDLPLPGQDDIVNPKGQPFKERFAAGRARTRLPDPENYQIIQVQGGYALRRNVKDSSSEQAQRAGDSDVAAGHGANGGADGAGSVGGVEVVGDSARGVAGASDSAEAHGRDGQAAPVPHAGVGAGAVGTRAQPTSLGRAIDGRPAGTRGTQLEDILNPKGQPFKTQAAAAIEQKKHEGSSVVEVPGGFAVRPQPTTLGASIEGRPAGTRGFNADDALHAAGNVATIDAAAAEAAHSPTNDRPEPTGPQADAGNYKKGHDAKTFPGLDLSIENPAGSIRKDKKNDPPKWQTEMSHHYGYIKGTEAADSTPERRQGIDFFAKPGTPEGYKGVVYVVDQQNADGSFDEHKVMLGFGSKQEAEDAYLSNYEDGWQGLQAITPVLYEDFKAWAFDGKKSEPFAQPEEAAEPEAPEQGESPAPEPTPQPPAQPQGESVPSEPKAPKQPKPEQTPETEEDVERVATPPDDAKIESQPVIDGKVKTTSGRVIDAPPPIRLGEGVSDRQVQNDVRKVETWLRKQAINEARARGNEFAAGQFRASVAGKLTPSDQDAMNVFLFGVENPQFTTPAPAEKKPKAEKPPADSLAELIDGSDASGIAEKVYEGLRGAEPEDNPIVFPDDKLIRMPVLVAERDAVEKALKKLGFRITDRSQESGTAGRVLVSALYRPEKGGIGDVGEQMAGARKRQGPVEVPPKDADEKAMDAFLAELHKSNYLDPDANAEQSFGAMMLKEAVFENIKSPLAFITDVLKRQFYDYSWDSPRAILKKALGNDAHRVKVDSLSKEYAERLTKLQDTLTPAKRVKDIVVAFTAAYGSRYEPTAEGRAINLVSDENPNYVLDKLAGLMEQNEDTTDQTHRVKKKDPDVPPRLERIIRVGMKDHRGGKNVADDDFLTTFGFRGLEFGNWVNQVERQENLNLAFDSLMDLADLTGLDPKVLGMTGAMGFAIGSRGKNPRAAAHFEPDNNVINLTKTKGNGTVGHEWFHGLDHNSSRVQESDKGGSVQEMRNAVNKLAEALKVSTSIEAADAYLRGLLTQANADSRRNTPPKQAVFEAIKGNTRYRYSAPSAYTQVFDRTAFQRDADKMDEGASKKYWSTPVEMLARGFESFLYDASKGGTPYLVGPTRGDGVMTAQNGFKGTPYPRGEERQYVAELYRDFLSLIDPKTLQLKSYKPEWTIREIKDFGWTAIDQHGLGTTMEGRMVAFDSEEAARKAADGMGDARRLNNERITNGRLNKHYADFMTRIDAIMEELGLDRWPELKNGSMAESMFFHLRQGWWPENNQALKVYAGKAYGIEASQIDLLKLKQAQEDFEAALGRYAAQRVVDMRETGADSRAIFDYLVSLYEKQPNLDVRTSTSQSNMAFSTPLPIGFVASLMGHVTSKSAVFDPTGGNGMLMVGANPKRVVSIELEPKRANNLRLMEYGKVIEGDATKKIDSDIRPEEADVALMNPPFGPLSQSVGVASWDGREFMMGKIDQLIAAKGMKAMAKGGRAVIILGAHRNAGTITSTDRVFLNWLYSNYNVVDHFEVDGKLYERQGASWPLRILVVAGKNETVSAFPVDAKVDRVYDFNQLWSRSDEARQRAEQVVVGAGVAPDGPRGADRVGDSVPAGDRGEAAGAGEVGGAAAEGAGNGDVADGAAGPGGAANDGPGAAGGATAGDGQRRGNGPVGGAGDGAAGAAGRGNRGRRVAAGTPTGGLSGLTDDDIDALIAGAMGGKKSAPKTGTTAGEGGNVATDKPRTTRGKATPGKSILDDIEGIGDLLAQLGAEFQGDGGPDDTPPTPKRKKAPAIERRDALASKRSAPAASVDATVRGSQANTNVIHLPTSHGYSQKTLARAAQAALDYEIEQAENPTAPAERVSSRAMFSRQMQEDAQYAKVQPILAAIWQRLSAAIADVNQRIKTFVVGAAQKFGNTVVPFVKRFIQDARRDEQSIPDGKRPIKAEAIDNEAQVVYRGRSSGDSAGIFVPRNQAIALERAFDAFEAEYGEVDQFVAAELGYDSIEDMHKGPKRGPSQGLAGYQVDALALAIGSMKRGDGFIIGDDTGVGKGRTGAALIAWAVKNDKVPVFFSYKADLYSAMWDDLTDIGMEDRIKPMPTDSDAVIRDRSGKTVLKNDAKRAKKALEHIIANGTMPEGQNAIFTTYYQNNIPNKRRDAIARLVRDGKAVLILDEAHNAAGESNTNDFFMSLLTGNGLFGGDKDNPSAPPDEWQGPQTTYLSATFAKRPSNMPVYIRTQLRHAANTPAELIDLFGSGGDVLQQIASEMLVSSGSMIRRERSYAGVKFEYITDEENAPRDSRDVDAATEVLRRVVYADRAFAEWVKTEEGNAAVLAQMPPGFSAAFAGSAADIAINKSEFTSVVHNYVGQLLLATKVKKSVELAIAALNAGEKPVLTLQNTMEAALNDYVGIEGITDGDPLPDFGWQTILTRGLKSARRVTFDAGTGNKSDKVRVVIPTEIMPPMIAAEFKKAEALIAKFKSDLPASPIDALRNELGKYSVIDQDGKTTVTKTPPEGAKARPLVAVEVTGREFGVDYSTAVPTYRRRQDPDNLEIIRGFQGGSRSPKVSIAPPIDVVILNSSGSTGISLHASETAIDQRPRRMIVMQPNPDIAVFKQTTGRIHRTGQVEWPAFTVLATGIPAERRQLAMLKKKIGSLFSNTSSGEGTTTVDAVDFINQYGDVITAGYLEDNEDVAAFISISIPTEPSGSDISRKASGRAALLSVDEQRDFFDTIEQQFLLEIEQRNATGTNALARRALDFQAAPVEMQVLEEGMDESNPFTASAFLTKYEVNVVGDIPNPEKVKAAIDSALAGGSAEAVVKKLVASLETKYDEARNQLMLRRSEIAAATGKADATEQEKKALTERLTALDKTIQGFAARREQTISKLSQSLRVGSGYREMTVGDVESSAVITGISAGKTTSKVGNPFAPSNIIIHFQRNLPAGRLSVPLTKIESNEYALDGYTHRPDLEDWFGLKSVSGGRKERWIAGGNLLRARSILKQGEILLHTMRGSTDQAPQVQGGILMPVAYQPGTESKSDFTIRYPGAAMDYVLSLVQSVMAERAERTGYDEHEKTAAALKEAARFPQEISPETRRAIAYSGSVLSGPKRGWNLEMSAYDGSLTLYVGKDFPKIVRSKELKSLIGDLSKKRNDSMYSGKVPTDPAKIKGVIKLLAWNSPIVAPDAGAELARTLSQLHFQADNGRKDASTPVASRSDASARSGGMTVEAAQAAADAIRSTWKNAPAIVVVRSINDPGMPRALRIEDELLRSDGAAASEGVFYPKNGTVYLIANRLSTESDVGRVLMHETLGHFGLRGTYGDAMAPILDRIATLNSKQVREAAGKLGYDFGKLSERRIAAEEVLAYMAQSQPELGWVQKVVAAIRTWLRENIPALSKLKLSDAEIIRDYLLPARRWVENGGDGPKGGNVATEPVFSRVQNNASGESAASIEAQGRLSQSRDLGRQTLRVGRDGSVTPIRGVTTADTRAYAGQVVLQKGVGSGEWTVMAQGDDVKASDIARAKARAADHARTEPALFSRAGGLSAAIEEGLNSVRDVKLPAGYVVGDFINASAGTPGRLGWWHKTVGTMYHLAERSPAFKRVYDSVQNFLNDTSYYAAEAADLAPNILPKLEHFRDVWKSPLSAADTKAVSAPIFEGTLSWARDEKGRARPISEIEAELGAVELDDKAHKLLRAGHVAPNVLRMWQGLPMDQYEKIIEGKFEKHFLKAGVVFSADELRKHFKLTDAQIGHYKEFRAAVDKSLRNLAISDMLRFGGEDVAAVREQALSLHLDDAAQMLRDHAFELAKQQPERADYLNDLGNKFIEKADKAKSLIDHGYAPLSRFGQYTLDVVDADGKRVYFGLFEDASERSKMARKLSEQFEGAEITQGTVSQEAYKLFAGVSPETLELFGEMLGLEADGDSEASKAFQTYLKLARSSRDSMKRLIKRKGIAGFSEDAGRVLAGFVYSNARQTSVNLHMKELDAAVNAIPKGDGQLQDEAVKLREYVKNPQEEAQKLRGVLFAQYLGGSVASAIVNATQPFAVTFPYLSQFGGARAAAKQMAAAVQDATKETTGDAALDAALKKAEEEGIVSPQEVHQLQAQAMGKATLRAGDGTRMGDAAADVRNRWSKFAFAWGKVFGVAEQFNRKVTFIAAYRTAVARGIENPAKFAEKAVAETQFTYNKGNKPQWARGTLGSVLFTFKQYSVNYVELLYRMATAGEPGSPEREAGRRAALLAIAVLFLMAGGDGLPFAEDAQDVIDGVMQRLGYNFSSKAKMRAFLAAQLGNGGADFVMHGVSGLPGAPIDVSGRLGLGNLIPGTGLLQQKADHTRDIMEVAGPAGDLAQRTFKAAGDIASGNVASGVNTLLPTAARNITKAYDMAVTGMYRDDRGRKVIDASAADVAAKLIGFQPRDVKRVQDSTSEVQREKGQYAVVKEELSAEAARAIFEGQGIEEVRARVSAWNERNPEAAIKLDMSSVLRRVREMRKSKEQRVADTAPKAIRNRVRAELAEEK